MVVFTNGLTSAGRLTKLRSWWKDLWMLAHNTDTSKNRQGNINRETQIWVERNNIWTEAFSCCYWKWTVNNTPKKYLARERMSYYYYQRPLKYNLKLYSAYIHVFKSKSNFFNRTIPAMQNHINNTKDVLRNHFWSGHHRWIINYWTFTTTHSSTYRTWRNGSNSPSSQHRVRIQYIKVAYWRYGSYHQPKQYKPNKERISWDKK